MIKSDHIRRYFATISMRLIHFAAGINFSPAASASPSRAPHGRAASPALPAGGFKDAPRAHDDVAPAEVEVIDAGHPLSGKRFRLTSIEQSTSPEPSARLNRRS